MENLKTSIVSVKNSVDVNSNRVIGISCENNWADIFNNTIESGPPDTATTIVLLLTILPVIKSIDLSIKSPKNYYITKKEELIY